MILRPPRSPLTHTLFPSTTLFRSPVRREVQIDLAPAAADRVDPPLHQLEPAEPVAGRLRAAHGIEGIAPDAAAEGTRRAPESKHFGDGGAVVGKAVDAGETRAEHPTLPPAHFGVVEACRPAERRVGKGGVRTCISRWQR